MPPRSGVAFPTTSGLYCLEFYWQLLWDPNSNELNNNSTPTRSPTGSLNRMFNRHQAEITAMQFRGYSLPVHNCNGTMRPSPCPISEALIRPRDLFRLLAVGMCHFLPVYYLGIVFLGRVEGQNITILGTFQLHLMVRLQSVRLQFVLFNKYVFRLISLYWHFYVTCYILYTFSINMKHIILYLFKI